MPKFFSSLPNFIFFPLLSFFLHCNALGGNSSPSDPAALAVLGLLAGNTATASPQAREPRPFRGRSFFVYSNGTQVYDWNNDGNIATLTDLTSVSGFLTESDSGRFAFANVSNSQFRIADSGINLSPHGDHYHVDKANPNIISTSRLNLQLGTPRSVTSKNGRAAFVFSGNIVRLVEEKNLIGQSSPTVISLVNPPTVGENTTMLWLNITKGIATEGSAFKFYSNVNTGTVETRSDVPSCQNPGYPSTHQTPVSGQSFSNLNAEFAYNHTAIYPCDNGVLVVRHADSNNAGAGTYTFSLVSFNGRSSNWQALFKNNNYSVFGRNTKPIFFGNFGSENETNLIRLDGETGLSRQITVPAYKGQNLATEQMLGKQVAILRNDGQVSVYDADTLTLVRDLRFLPENAVLSGTNAPRFYSTWSAAFVLYSDTTGASFLQEINLEEALVTRKLNLTGNPLALSFHLGRMKGSDYEGPPHQ